MNGPEQRAARSRVAENKTKDLVSLNKKILNTPIPTHFAPALDEEYATNGRSTDYRKPQEQEFSNHNHQTNRKSEGGVMALGSVESLDGPAEPSRPTFMPTAQNSAAQYQFYLDPKAVSLENDDLLKQSELNDSDLNFMSNDFDEKIDQKSYVEGKKHTQEKGDAIEDSDDGFFSDEVDEKRSHTP